MTNLIRKQLFFVLLFLILGSFFTSKSHAASLSIVSDTLTTSRPSSAAPLASDQAASATQVTVVDLPTSGWNSALWLASDSAVLLNDTGQSLSTVNIASMSASISNQRYVYFTAAPNPNVAHHKGTTMITPITATHIIRFTTNSAIPSGGHIVITFPGSASNIASPSASTFSFNNLGSSAVICNPTTACSGTYTISSPSITLTTGAAISGSTAIVVAIGCTGTVSAAGICSTVAPALINPIKVNQTTCSGSTCTADTWKVTIKTQDNTGIDLDSSSVKIGTIESVQVQGIVEPSLTFTITGLSSGTNITTQNASCTGGDITNPGAGLNATATFVNLGSLAPATINISAQELSVSTNGSSGYAITATSSGRFINAASGFWLTDANTGNGLTANDTPVPAVFPLSGNAAFGIHPCGADVTVGTWANAATGFNSGAKYSNPWNFGINGFNASIASYNAPVAARKTEIEYAATAGTTTPAGTYSTVFTFVATPIF